MVNGEWIGDADANEGYAVVGCWKIRKTQNAKRKTQNDDLILNQCHPEACGSRP
jgi:hypothetical protein